MPGASNYTFRKKIHPFRLVRHACTFAKPAIRRKKAILIAVGTAIGMSNLVGPWMDVEKVRIFLVSRGYDPKNILILTDKPGSAEDVRPTYKNILDKVEHFLDNQIDGTNYFFYYAGHTAQQPSEGEEEEDRKSECILPCDSKPLRVDGEASSEQYYENCILDSDLKKHLVDRLSAKSRLVAIMDSCHSGTLLNLTHHRCNRVYAMSALWRRALRRVLEPYHQHRRGDRLFSLVSLLVPALVAEHGPVKAKLVCHGLCPRTEWSHNVICISACKDDQQAFEAGDGLSLTHLIIQLLEKEPRPTLKRFMRQTTADFRALSKKLKKQWKGPGKFGPIAAPQVSSPQPLNMDQRLIL